MLRSSALVLVLSVPPLLFSGLFTPLKAHAIPFSSSLMNIPGQISNTFRYEGSLASSADIADQNRNLDRNSHQVFIELPVKQDKKTAIVPRLNVEYQSTYSDGEIPGGLSDYPRDLWNASLGTDLLFMTDEGDRWGISGSYGWAAPHFFNKTDGKAYDATLFYQFDLRKKKGWLYLANFSNNRNYLNGLPIPGAAYYDFTNRNFRYIIGLPMMMVSYTMNPRLNFMLMSSIGRTTKLMGQYLVAAGEVVVFGVDWYQSGYFHDALGESGDRLFVDEKFGYAGLKARIDEKSSVTIKGGLAFDRSVYRSSFVFSHPDGLMKVKPSLMGQVSLGIGF